MNDESMVFTPGTLVWVKLKSTNTIWWPGKVVHPSTVPEALLKDYIHKKKKFLAIVSFETDSTYDIVSKMAEIFLYSCARKMEFLKIGYSLYLKQKKSKFTWSYNMENFIKDVLNIEKNIGGEDNIFQQFEIKTDSIPTPVNIKELFVTEKQRKLMEKKKKLLLTKSLVSKKKPQRKNSKPSTSQSTTPTCKHKCVENGCTFTTNYSSTIKRHIARHEIEKNGNKKIVKTNTISNANNSTDDNSIASFQTSKKLIDKKNLINKKMKLEDQISTQREDGKSEHTVNNTYKNVTGTIASSSKLLKKYVDKKKSHNKKMKVKHGISTKLDNSEDKNTVQSSNKNVKRRMASSQTLKKYVDKKKSTFKNMISQDDISTEWESSDNESTVQNINENVTRTFASFQALKKSPNKNMILQDDVSTEWESSENESTVQNINENVMRTFASFQTLKKSTNKNMILQDEISTEFEDSEDETTVQSANNAVVVTASENQSNISTDDEQNNYVVFSSTKDRQMTFINKDSPTTSMILKPGLSNQITGKLFEKGGRSRTHR